MENSNNYRNNGLFDPSLQRLFNNIKVLFAYRNDKFEYNDKTQSKASELIKKICNITGIFKEGYQYESNVIKEVLSYTETNGNKIPLLNLTLNDIEEVIDDNNMLTCLRTMVLCNKIAHEFERQIESNFRSIVYYYNLQYGSNSFLNGDISFFQPFNIVFPNIRTNNLYNINRERVKSGSSHLRKTIKKIQNAQSGNASQSDKQNVLDDLNIKYSYNSEEIDNLVKAIDIQKVIDSWIYILYTENQELVKKQSIMYKIKDDYIIMIAQLLKTQLKDLKYELVETTGTDIEPNRKYLLIIDDERLAYPLEVHMPNYLCRILVNECGLNPPIRRTIPQVEAKKVVRERTDEEIRKLNDALINDSLLDKGKRFAKVITRPKRSNSEELSSKKEYSYETQRMIQGSELFETFLHNIKGFEAIISSNQELMNSYQLEYSLPIICEKYYDIFIGLSDEYKKEFIAYARSELQKGNDFDRTLVQNNVINNMSNINILGQIFIYKNLLKYNYYQNYEAYGNNVDNYLNDIIRKRFETGMGRGMNI